jgi:hypothetical protein
LSPVGATCNSAANAANGKTIAQSESKKGKNAIFNAVMMIPLLQAVQAEVIIEMFAIIEGATRFVNETAKDLADGPKKFPLRYFQKR